MFPSSPVLSPSPRNCQFISSSRLIPANYFQFQDWTIRSMIFQRNLLISSSSGRRKTLRNSSIDIQKRWIFLSLSISLLTVLSLWSFPRATLCKWLCFGEHPAEYVLVDAPLKCSTSFLFQQFFFFEGGGVNKCWGLSDIFLVLSFFYLARKLAIPLL